MKTIKKSILAIIAASSILSCSKDDVQLLDVVANQVSNLAAVQTSDYTTNPPTINGDFIKFNFSEGLVTTSETDWDIAFRGTSILVNGGSSSGMSGEPTRTGNAAAYVASGVFNEITEANTSLFLEDSESGLAIPTGSGNGWYSYNPTSHLITPIAGKVLVFKTHDNKFAKVEILSYYKDQDSSSSQNGQHYTFNYVYQPNEGVASFE